MNDVVRRHLIVHGEVQGVGFRFSTEGEADRIGVAGYARNLADGTVEIEAEGSSGDVETLIAWVRAGGPMYARVDRVEVTKLEPTGEAGFETRR